MKSNFTMLRRMAGLLALLLFALHFAVAQSKYKVPITITTTASVPITLKIGVNGDGPGGSIVDNTIGYDKIPTWGGDSTYQDMLSPPAPPDPYALDARLITPPSRPTSIPLGLGGGALEDYRGFTSTTQIDTFVVQMRGHDDVGTDNLAPVTLTWPSGLNKLAPTWVLKARSGATFTDVNMLSTTSTVITPAAGGPVQVYIIKTGSLAVSVENAGNALPASYALSQNFPNPFNPTTSIRFDLPERAQTTLHVYDLLGRVVRTLVNTTLNPGSYQVTLDGEGLSSGMYIYRLQAGPTVLHRRMMLLK